MIVRNISADVGKYNTKICVKRTGAEGIQRVCIRTKVDETNANNNIFLGNTSLKVNFEGKEYLVGEAAETVSYETSKALNIHRVALYSAIASGNLIDNGDVVNLTIGAPMSMYLNHKICKEFKNYIAPVDTIITITVNGVTKSFTFGKVIVLPESSGILFSDVKRFMGKTVAVVDIGGLNANCSIFRNLSPVLSAVFTCNAGSNVMQEELQKRLNVELSVQIPNYMMDQILLDGYIKKDLEKSAQIIHDYKLEHVCKLKNECVAKGWDFDTINNLIFCGGTSLGLKKEILEVFPYTDESNFVPNAEFANAEGFLKFLLGQTSINR